MRESGCFGTVVSAARTDVFPAPPKTYDRGVCARSARVKILWIGTPAGSKGAAFGRPPRDRAQARRRPEAAGSEKQRWNAAPGAA